MAVSSATTLANMKQIHIGLDGVAFSNTYQKGIQRYYEQILRRVSDEFHISVYTLGRTSVGLPENVHVVEAKEHNLVRGYGPRSMARRIVGKAKRQWFNTPFPASALFHSTYFTECPLPGVPTVLTVHDMLPEVMPYHADGDVFKEIERKRVCILKADSIITVSQATMDDLVSVYPEVGDRVRVVHSGGGHLPLIRPSDPDQNLLTSAPSATFIGDRRGYKNFHSVLDAMCEASWPADLKLVVIGAPFSDCERVAIRYRSLESRISSIVFPDDLLLARHLASSHCFLFPSLLEGFGFPILEAQSSGVPVVASDTRVFREIGGRGFQAVDSRSPTALAQGVARVFEPGCRQELIREGFENVRRFSWEKCARETSNVWRELAMGS